MQLLGTGALLARRLRQDLAINQITFEIINSNYFESLRRRFELFFAFARAGLAQSINSNRPGVERAHEWRRQQADWRGESNYIGGTIRITSAFV